MKKGLFVLGMMLSLHATAQSHWKLQYVWEGAGMVNILSKKSDVVISLPDKKISGSTGCNSFEGKLEYLKGDKIKPIKLVNKKANCPATPDKLDNAVLTALNTATKLVINQDKAKFYQGEKLVLELKR